MTAAPTGAPALTPAPSPASGASGTADGMTADEARRLLSEFDPGTGDPVVLEAALAVLGPRPALGLPAMIETGSDEVREVVFAVLATDSPWSIGTLVGMQEFGMPSGTFDAARRWPSQVRIEMAEALRESAPASYGDLADLMIDANRHLVVHEVELCIVEACEWDGGWYAVPSTLTNPTGRMIGSRIFEGSVTILSDSGLSDSGLSDIGTGEEMPLTMRRLNGWVPVEGFLSDPPAFGLLSGPSVLFDGSIVSGHTIKVLGWAERDTKIRIGDQSVVVEGGWWEMSVPVPDDGLIEMIGQQPDGATRTEEMHVLYLPDADRQFAFITAVGQTLDGQPAFEVDFAEFFGPDSGTMAARWDGAIGPTEFVDFYVRNEDPGPKLVPVADDALARLIDATHEDLVEVTVPVDEFERIMLSGDDGSWHGVASDQAPFWLIVDGDGTIRQVQQMSLA